MINQFYAMIRTAEPSVPASSGNKASRTTADEGSRFKDIMDSKLNRSSRVKSSADQFKRNPVEKAEDGAVNSDMVGRQKVESYRAHQNAKAVRNTGNTEKKEPVYEKPESMDEKKDLVKKSSNAAAFVEGLAQILGMNPQDLVMLLESAGIELSDMADDQKVGEIASKLAEFMQLSESQADALTDILNSMKNLTVSSEEDAQVFFENNKGDVNRNWVNVDHERLTVVNRERVSDISEIMAEFKSKLAEMGTENSGVAADTDEELNLSSPLKENVNSEDKAITTEYMAPDSTDEGLEAFDGDSLQQGSLNTDTKSKDPLQNVLGKAVSEDNQQETDSIADAGNIATGSFAIGTSEKAGFEAVNRMAAENAPVSAREILNQIVEKAEAVITGDKSEMVMDLKPDHLGKLSLKLVTENGIVMANFVADSQQVKEVLEANMQLLKSALEKQGFIVQGFNVSVGSDSQKGLEKRSFAGERTTVHSVRNRTYSGLTAGNGLVMTNIPENLNPYMRSDSSIDLTA